ncbi:MAG: heavy metal translocating P-type ATPase [Hydrogenobacter thermophilus]|uniref:heavy metal translocating P-type ATPase n=1 Tax=Hydrogenobacter thermophilus TaxID=940 RepID=UPI001C774F2F|nr:heavy metal translocating P-type ATPase [Hydrogenobacter thermophilus]QWK19307.1 MAG: heavy metal translocating P-type ATPase [Hydrogenobacter thermophilus]
MLYTCPMHPEVMRETPGKCPKCGMDLVPTEHPPRKHDHAMHMEEIKRKAIVSTVLTIPIVLYSKSIQELLHFSMPEFPGSEWITPVLSTIVFFYGGTFFLKGMVEELRLKKPGMMTLIGIAIGVAFIYSLSTLLLGGMAFFWELATLIVVMLWGHWIEMRSVLGASRAVEELAKLMPTKANLLKDGEIVEVHVSELKPGDIVLVKPGEKIPVDGIVIEGLTHMNEAMLTGESKPVPKGVGDRVIGGAINMEGSIKVKVEKTGEETYLSQVLKLVKEAQESKTKLQDVADRVAFYLTVVAIGVGGLAFLVWLYLKGDLQFAVERAVTVMVIACPHALGLAIPLVVAISTSYSAKNGILVRNRLALEAIKYVDTVIFDKTGTLTEGKFGVSEVVAVGISERELLKLTAAVEERSEHVIARAIVEEARGKGVSFPEVKNFRAIPGKGVVAEAEGKEVAVGTSLLMEELKVEKETKILNRVKEFESFGKTVVLVAINRKLTGAIALSDKIRRESYEAVSELKRLGKRVVMITGDSEEVASYVARELGIDEFFARVLPHQKAQKVKELQSKGRKVAMVGDGINDAPALAQADVGIAIGSGTDVAIESAGIILVKDDPRDVVRVVRLSSITVRKMFQNLFWATSYNLFAIPLAAGIGYRWGILLPPAVGALLMSLSTLIVSVNALLMRRSLK